MTDTPPMRRPSWLLLSLAAVLGLALALRASLPWIAERALEPLLSDALDARVEIGGVDLGLLEGEVTLLASSLVSLEGEELFRARRIALDLDWAALIFLDFEAERVAIEAPELFLVLDAQGRFNWSAVAAGGGPESDDEKPPAPFRIAIAELDLGEGEIRWRDENEGGLPTVRLQLGAFTLLGVEVFRASAGGPVSWGVESADATDWRLGVARGEDPGRDFAIRARAGPTSGDRIPLELEVTGEDGIRLGIEGALRTTPLAIDASVDWKGLRSPGLLLLAGVRGFRVERGLSRGKLAVALDLAEVPERGLTVSGEVVHEDLSLVVDGEQPTRIEAKAVEVKLERLRVPIPAFAVEPPEPVSVRLARLVVDAPRLETTLPAERGAPEEPSDPPEAGDGVGLHVVIDSFSLREGRVRWSDPAVGPDHGQSLSQIGVEATALRWPELGFEKGELRVGSLGASPLHIAGSWAPEKAALELRANRVPLAPWNSELSGRSDYSISQGELSARSSFSRSGQSYEAPTTLTFHRLRASSRGGAFQKTFGMPLAAAIPLLSDPSGNIQLSLSVRGNAAEGAGIDLPRAVIGAMREALFNAFTSTLASPLDLVGSVFRRMGEVVVLGVGEAPFAPGDASLALDAKLVLDSASQLVSRAPGARLELIPQITVDDLQALGAAERPTVVDSLLDAGRALVGRRKELDRAVRRQLEPLAQGRARAVADYLENESGLPAARIVVREWDEEPVDGIPRVLLRLLLADPSK